MQLMHHKFIKKMKEKFIRAIDSLKTKSKKEVAFKRE